MKKYLLSTLAIVAITGTAFAGTSSKSFKQPVIDEAIPCFADNEFTIDAFGTYQVAEKGGFYKDGFGGGVGMNAFFARYFGIGVEGYWNTASSENSVIHAVNGSLILRYPIDSICLAPYIFGGGGGMFDSVNVGTGFAGAGLEYRFRPNMGIFGDGRYVFTSENNLGLFRVGLRFAF